MKKYNRGTSKNNWLSVRIDPGVLQQLFEATKSIQQILLNINVKCEPTGLSGIHMTAVFMGENLHKIDQTIPGQLKTLNSTDPVEFKFISFDLFPPNKNNIIIARYECPDAFKNKIRSLVDTIDNLSKLDLKSTNNFYPHVTLCRLKGKIPESLLQTIDALVKTVQVQGSVSFTSNELFLCGKVFAPNKEDEEKIKQNWLIKI